MNRLAIVAVLAGCAAQVGQRDVLRPGDPIPWETIEIKTDADAMKVWVALDPRGRDFPETLAEIPPAHRSVMAKAILSDGTFECEAEVVEDACGRRESRLPALAPDSGLESGCLRRKLAVWAIAAAPSDDRAVLAVAGNLALLPLPERELHRAVLARFGTSGPHLAGWVEDTGDEETADAFAAAQSGDLLVPLAEYGIDGAIEALIAVHRGPDALARAARATGHVRPETWVHLVAALQRERANVGAVSRVTLDRAIAGLVATGDCRVGGAAGISDRPERQTVASVENWNYMACFWLTAQGAASVFLRDDMIGEQGIAVVNGTATTHLAADAGFEMPFADELPDALVDCTTSTCPLPGTHVEFRLQLDARGRLETIERHVTPGDC